MDMIIFIIIVIAIITMIYAKTQNQKAFKQDYDNALQGNDKRRALEAGRNYYSSLRGNKRLTIYDESAITNDLLSMKENTIIYSHNEIKIKNEIDKIIGILKTTSPGTKYLLPKLLENISLKQGISYIDVINEMKENGLIEYEGNNYIQLTDKGYNYNTRK